MLMRKQAQKLHITVNRVEGLKLIKLNVNVNINKVVSYKKWKSASELQLNEGNIDLIFGYDIKGGSGAAWKGKVD